MGYGTHENKTKWIIMPFATEDEVRLSHGFSSEKEFHNETGTTFFLPIRAYSIISLSRNGVLQTDPANFSFTPPKKIKFIDGEPLQQSEFLEIIYATALRQDEILDCLDDAEEEIKAILADRFGEARVEEWETTTPPYLKHRAKNIAGKKCELVMLRKARDFDPDAIDTIEKSIDRELAKLTKVDLGIISLIGEVPVEDEAVVGLGGQQIFSELDQIEDFDYHEYYAQTDNRERGKERNY